jgi:DNA-binding NarL/FixJ family response regulator
MKLLIVDDHPVVRQIIRRLLEDLADEISECEDGELAVNLFPVLLPDWVVMDVEMKNLDGLAATKQIKAAFPEARIVIATNHDDKSLREAAMLAGASGYVLKENLFTLRTLLTAGKEPGSPLCPENLHDS